MALIELLANGYKRYFIPILLQSFVLVVVLSEITGRSIDFDKINTFDTIQWIGFLIGTYILALLPSIFVIRFIFPNQHKHSKSTEKTLQRLEILLAIFLTWISASYFSDKLFSILGAGGLILLLTFFVFGEPIVQENLKKRKTQKETEDTKKCGE